MIIEDLLLENIKVSVEEEISVDEEDKEEEEKEKITSSYQVDNGTMQRLKEFYDNDVDIQTCRERKKTETLRHPCSIAWWLDEKVMLKEVPLLSDKHYMKSLHDMMWIAQDYLSLFRYVALYYVKDMEAWLTKKDGSLPFGVVELGISTQDNIGKYFWQRKEGQIQRELIFTCSDDSLLEKYDFYVFNDGAVFKPLVYRGAFSSFGDDVGEVIPLSPFTALCEDWNDLVEARTCLMDANFNATHPEAFIVSKPPPDTQIENVSDDIRYALDDIGHARSFASYDKAGTSSSAANGYRKKFIQSHGARGTSQYPILSKGIGEGGEEEEYTLYHERQATFPHPSMKDTMVEMPNYMEVIRGPAPTSLIKPEELALRYEHKICGLMNFPHLFFKATSGGVSGSGGTKSSLSGGGAGNGGLLFAQRQLEDSICKQQMAFDQIFSLLYEKTFARLDEQFFGEAPSHVREVRHRITVRMKFDTRIKKTDESIRDLLPFFQHGIVSGEEVRDKVLHNYGIIVEEDDDEWEDYSGGGTPPPVKKKRRVDKLINHF
jgi:hypothetical protein